jgi:hypothetical protein
VVDGDTPGMMFRGTAAPGDPVEEVPLVAAALL